ncbi:hypothetical protein SAMN05877838_3820 [Hoeflea halophila]|uniref:PilZ domain-containing protein n=1 Tax=Hoeflea halophila TaxID=714899 RepID=A0A286IFF8_9HYPH|nr:hypothetical protein [Hoeflea halophila]SOE18875.1 hypothetical protein SAMN05877838_3820 [Hoeflea halophila]
MKPKNYLLTRSGEELKETRRVYPRRDANCPVIARVRQRGREEQVSVPCWLVNLCEEGCMLTSDHFPRKIDEVHLTIPGISTPVRGRISSQGKFTINVRFAKLLKVQTVDVVARIKTIPKP